jgi:hypothetical protein
MIVGDVVGAYRVTNCSGKSPLLGRRAAPGPVPLFHSSFSLKTT